MAQVTDSHLSPQECADCCLRYVYPSLPTLLYSSSFSHFLDFSLLSHLLIFSPLSRYLRFLPSQVESLELQGERGEQPAGKWNCSDAPKALPASDRELHTSGEEVGVNLGSIQPDVQKVELLLRKIQATRIQATIESARSKATWAINPILPSICQKSKNPMSKLTFQTSKTFYLELTKSSLGSLGLSDSFKLWCAPSLREAKKKRGWITWVTDIPEDQIETTVNKSL